MCVKSGIFDLFLVNVELLIMSVEVGKLNLMCLTLDEIYVSIPLSFSGVAYVVHCFSLHFPSLTPEGICSLRKELI